MKDKKPEDVLEKVKVQKRMIEDFTRRGDEVFYYYF